MISNTPERDLLAEFGRRYLWWKPVEGVPFSEQRVIDQTMNLGTYDTYCSSNRPSVVRGCFTSC